MVLAAKVKKLNAEKARKALIRNKMIDFNYLPSASGEFIYFPIIRSSQSKLEKRKSSFGIEALANKSLNRNKREKVSLPPFDIIGEIAIFELPKEYKNAPESAKTKAAKEIGRKILSHHRNIKTVAVKTGAIKGQFRIRSFKIVGGKRSALTLHREYGCRFKIDVSKAYYSPRLSFERNRINNLIKRKETIFIPFAGVGPFAIIIAKTHPNCKVYANELNPAAYKHLKENIILNKVSNVVPVPGDARELAKKHARRADRIIMPLPMSSDQFLDVAFKLAKRNCTVHFYYFAPSLEKAEQAVTEAARQAGKKVKIVLSRDVRNYAPDITEYVIDFKVLN